MNRDFKDHFSGDSDLYQAYRPRYPQALFKRLSALTEAHELAWDCATGNGQAAQQLQRYFARVIATDASHTQIENALPAPGITYRVATAERSGISSHTVDLITVAQAMHWFDIDRFRVEVSRVLKPGGVLAAWTYGLTRIAPGIDEVVNHLYGPVLESYWPEERRLVENGYRDFDLPFAEIDMPPLEMTEQWSLSQLLGYLGTWSAVKRYRQHTGNDPLAELRAEFRQQWGSEEETKTINWPLHMRVWRTRHE